MHLTINENIHLETISKKHAEILFQLVDSNQEFLGQWMPWVKTNLSIENTRKFIAQSETNVQDSLNAGIFLKDRLCGMIGLHLMNALNKNTSMGYWLGKNHQGYGIVTLSAREMIRYCFQDLQMHRIELRCGIENFKSQAVAERLGFFREGLLKEAELLNGLYIDQILYALLNIKNS